MDFENFRKVQLDKLNELISKKDAAEAFQMMEMADCAEKSNIEKDIKSVELQKAKAELVKVEAETEKVKAETKTSKVDRICKVGGLVLTGVGTVVGAGAMLFLNGMNIAAHSREEMKYSSAEESCERNIFNKSLDLFMRKK